LSAAKSRIASGNHIGRDPALPVGRPREWDQRPLAGDEVLDFDRVADGEDIGIARSHVLIDADAAAPADLDPGHLRQRRLRTHADRQDHDVCRMSLAGAREDFQRTVLDRLEPGHPIIEFQSDAVLDHVAFDEARHLRIQRGHDLVELLDQGHFQPAVDQVLHHFEADEAAADHHSTPRLGYRLVARVGVHPRPVGHIPVQPLAHVPGVRYGPHREDPGEIDAGQRRADRRCPGRQHELVVLLRGYLPGRVILQFDGFLLGGDADHLAARSAVDRKLFAECLLCRHQKA
jgi:hypothetical protein